MSWIDWAIFVAELIKFIVIHLPKMGYEAARSLAFETVSTRHGIDIGELEANCGSTIDEHFGK